jgi:hypothetical protein
MVYSTEAPNDAFVTAGVFAIELLAPASNVADHFEFLLLYA